MKRYDFYIDWDAIIPVPKEQESQLGEFVRYVDAAWEENFWRDIVQDIVDANHYELGFRIKRAEEALAKNPRTE